MNTKTILLVRSIQKEIRNQQARFESTRSVKDIDKAVWFTVVCITILIIRYLPFCVTIFLPHDKKLRPSRHFAVSMLNFIADITPVIVLGFHKDIEQHVASLFKCNALSRLNKRADSQCN